MNKLLVPIAIVLIAVAGFFVWQTKYHQPSTVISGWKTFTDAQQGVTFQYPDKLPTTYIAAQTWPPVVKLVSSVSACAVEPFTINGRSYCVQAQTDSAAGSVYTAYTYSVAVPHIDKTIQISFTLRSVQCANYSDPQKTTCEAERTSFNLDNLVDKIVSTVKE